MLLIQGCAHLNWRPTPSEEEKSQYGTIALIKANFLPTLKFDTYAVGTAAGAWKGAGEGAMNTIAAACTSGGREAGVLICALGIALSPVGALVGGVLGTRKAIPEEKAKAVNDTMKKALADLRIQERMTDHIANKCSSLTEYTLRVSDEKGPAAFDKISDYRALHAEGIDTVLEVSVTDIGFRGGEGKDLLLSFFMNVHARLIRTEDGGEIQYPGEYSCISLPRHFNEWADNDSSLLNQQIQRCYETLADQIVDATFVELSPPEKSTMEKLSSWPDRYTIALLSPAVTWNHFLSTKPITPKADSLQPKLVWAAFPTVQQRQLDKSGRLDNISNITYELKIWKMERDFPTELVYYRQGLNESSHKVESYLEPSTKYCWCVRARFEFGGHYRTTAWTYPDKPGLYYEVFVTPP
jgi:hypothetical protein